MDKLDKIANNIEYNLGFKSKELDSLMSMQFPCSVWEQIVACIRSRPKPVTRMVTVYRFTYSYKGQPYIWQGIDRNDVIEHRNNRLSDKAYSCISDIYEVEQEVGG